LQKPTKVEK